MRELTQRITRLENIPGAIADLLKVLNDLQPEGLLLNAAPLGDLLQGITDLLDILDRATGKPLSKVSGDDDDSTPTNYALSFDGANDYVSATDSTSLDWTGNELTVEAWIKVNELGRSNQCVLSKGFRGDSYGYMLRIDHLDQLSLDIGDGTGCAATKSFPSGYLNEWIHVAGVYKAPNLLIYLNGAAFTSETCSSALGSTDDDLHIGSMTTAFFYGEIDEVRVSKVARYSSNFVPEDSFTSDSDTLGLWHFDEGKELKD